MHEPMKVDHYDFDRLNQFLICRGQLSLGAYVQSMKERLEYLESEREERENVDKTMYELTRKATDQ